MTSPWRGLFAAACWLPALLIITLAVWSQEHPAFEAHLSLTELRALLQLPHDELVTGGMLIGLTALLQLGLAAVVALFLDKRPELTTVEKILWPTGCLFFGSIVLPICYVREIRHLRPL